MPIVIVLLAAVALVVGYTIYQKQLSATPFPPFDNTRGEPAQQAPPSNSYACPNVEWVNCMPMFSLGGKLPQNPKCAPEYLKWAKDTCPGFQGAAY